MPAETTDAERLEASDLLDSLRAQNGKGGAAETASIALRRVVELTVGRNDLKLLFVECRLHTLTLRLLELWPAEEQLNRYGLAVLTNLSSRSGTRSSACLLVLVSYKDPLTVQADDVQREVTQLGGLKRASAALDTWKDVENHSVVLAAVNLVAVLVQLEANKRAAVKLGLHTALLGVLDVFYEGTPSSVGVIERACFALAHICYHPEHKKLVVENGAVEQVVAVMKKWGTEPRLQENALFLLGTLAMTKETADVINSAGGIEWTMKSMNKLGNEADVMFRAAFCAGNLSCFDLPRVKIIALNGIDHVHAMLRHYGERDSRITHYGLFALSNMARSDENVLAITRTGAVVTACKLIRLYPRDARIIRYGLALLECLATLDDNRGVIGAELTLEYLATVMVDAQKSERVTTRGLALTALLLRVRRKRSAMIEQAVEAGFKDIVEKARKRFRNNSKIIERCQRITGFLDAFEAGEDVMAETLTSGKTSTRRKARGSAGKRSAGGREHKRNASTASNTSAMSAGELIRSRGRRGGNASRSRSASPKSED